LLIHPFIHHSVAMLCIFSVIDAIEIPLPTARTCGRFILGESSWAEYHEALSILRPEPAKVSNNIKPTQSILSVVRVFGTIGGVN